MSYIKLDDIGIEFSGSYLFKDITCSVEHNSRIGLIGANGCGKTTLLKIMLREMEPSTGIVTGSKSIRMAYLSQNPEFETELSVEEYIRSSREDLQAAWKEIIAASAENNLKKLHTAEEMFQKLGGYEFDTEMKMTLTALRFPAEMWRRKLTSLSGGERTRLALANILLSRFDLLLLDEPTNHLDIAMINWLEKYLCNQSRPYLIISHDRTFLDKTVTSVYCMEYGNLSITKGNYSSWYEAQKIRILEQERQWKQQQKWLKETKDFIARNIAGQKTKQAKGRLKILNRTEIIEKPKEKHSLNLKVKSQDRSGNDVFRLENVHFGIADKVLAKEVNLYCGYRDRICLLGQNGSGKTTLIRLLLGNSEPIKGLVKIGASLQIGYYDQYQNELDENLTVYETLKQLVQMATDGYILGWLARFGFRNDDVHKYVSVLSGGEKSRLYLSTLIHEKPNLLILDEPTNHLDIMMMDALLYALQEYDGTIIFVSHDRYFIQQLATKYWVFHKVLENNTSIPTVSEIDKSFEELLTIAYSEPETEKKKTEQINNRQKKVNPWILEQLQKEIEQYHQALHTKQSELIEVQLQLSRQETYSQGSTFKELHKQVSHLEQDIKECQIKIDQLETRYLELIYEPTK
ncbi:MAG: ATP-binding cassette domain-containing protein [Candidatus Cloacimonetes bacterium]|nr:ATP-binding cassette domain-containing protein [Candidatus Cloacimonadota bacterium]